MIGAGRYALKKKMGMRVRNHELTLLASNVNIIVLQLNSRLKSYLFFLCFNIDIYKNSINTISSQRLIQWVNTHTDTHTHPDCLEFFFNTKSNPRKVLLFLKTKLSITPCGKPSSVLTRKLVIL